MQIDDNVPIPKQERGPKALYPFRDMSVGQSVFYPHQNGSGKAATAAKVHGYRAGKKFASRKVEGGVRIWRVE